MSFTEWYKEEYGEEWTTEQAVLRSYFIGYENYCYINQITLIWNG